MEGKVVGLSLRLKHRVVNLPYPTSYLLTNNFEPQTYVCSKSRNPV